MKKLTLLTALVLVIHVSVSSQPCLPDGITFSTQSEIDNFQINYPNCTKIGGDVYISGNNITNLNGLSVVTSIDSGLYVLGSPLVNLNGLSNLQSIGTNLGIANNNHMISLVGIENLTSIGESINILNNNSLTNLNGLQNITELNDFCYIDQNISLNNLTGFDGINSIGGVLSIWANSALSDITALGNLESIGGALYIADCDNLVNLSGLDNLHSTAGNLDIYRNAALVSISQLSNLSSIEGYLRISKNSLITSLVGLENIENESVADLRIYDNPLLSTCEVESICEILASPNGEIEIHDNDGGCMNQNEVELACQNLGINNITSTSKFNVYPNPTDGTIFIENKSKSIIDKIIIYNQYGVKVFTSSKSNGNIDISGLCQGFYVIEIKSNHIKTKKKLIIK